MCVWPAAKMDSVEASFDGTMIVQVLRYIFFYTFLDVLFHGSQTLNITLGRDSARSIVWGLFIVSMIITVCGRIWLSFVTSYAPEPYLVRLLPFEVKKKRRVRKSTKQILG